MDSQSVDTATMISKDVGVDANKRVRGRKRHVMVDSLGLLWVMVVTAANIAECKGLHLSLQLIQSLHFNFTLNLERLYLIYVDGVSRL
ncbi:MAG: transposase [Limnothrix sp.]